MIQAIIIVSILAVCWYLTAVLILFRGIGRLPKAGEPGNHTFSIVIAARNEQLNIANCLDSILKQSIDPSRYEVIVVNDRSTDKTAQIVKEYIDRGAPVKLINVESVPQGIAPKKNAVSIGTAEARNELIVFTDADCVVLPSWLETIDRHFTKNTGLLQGITSYFPVQSMNAIFFGLQAVDFLSHNIVSASAIGAGMPINSNANNLVFRKQVFHDIGGYGDDGRIVSGDDDLLVQRVWRNGKWKVNFMADPAGAVTTAPTPTVKGVFEQHKRWGSKTTHYRIRQILFLAGIFLFYCMILITGLMFFVNSSVLVMFIGMLGVKIAGELLLMVPGTALFNKKELRPYIVPASLLQLPVVIGAILFGTFGTFSWKGDNFRKKL